MSVSELDTFNFKFKNLLLAEKNATLSLKSDAGRAQVTLSVNLGHLLLEPGPQLFHQVGNGPARLDDVNAEQLLITQLKLQRL